MTRWKREIPLKPVLVAYQDEHHDFERLVDETVKVLRSDPDEEIRGLAEEFAECTDEADFDDELNELYDYADAVGLWIGERAGVFA